ncbi:MAG TPA: ATP-binding cassette domain-containing protein [Candidatus Dormibacteraeota bacterium]|jgi:cell division transport system ATP-binding protein|nr:ATP-binding cassette domain-containing protein [Candidatus Dormibacteraeota bacterium]
MTNPQTEPIKGVAVHFENVRQVYADLIALDRLTLSFSQGELIFLAGASGAGKSTILKLINGELRPSEGMLWVDGMSLHNLASSQIADLRRRVGVVFQDYQLLPRLTTVENVAFAIHVADLAVTRSQAAILARSQLEAVGLSSRLDAYPNQLSGGQQQRLAIARALVGKPQILLADEPTGNLDQATARPIIELLEMIASSGTTVVVATHDPELIHSTRGRVVTVARGRVESDRSLRAVLC